MHEIETYLVRLLVCTEIFGKDAAMTIFAHQTIRITS